MLSRKCFTHREQQKTIRRRGTAKNKGRTLADEYRLKKRKVLHLDHVLRNPKFVLPQKSNNGKSGKKANNRPKSSFCLRNIRKWTGLNVEPLFHSQQSDRYKF